MLDGEKIISYRAIDGAIGMAYVENDADSGGLLLYLLRRSDIVPVPTPMKDMRAVEETINKVVYFVRLVDPRIFWQEVARRQVDAERLQEALTPHPRVKDLQLMAPPIPVYAPIYGPVDGEDDG